MKSRDWILLTLAAADGRPLSPAQLQKSLFLLSRAMPEKDRADFYQFIPYHYGPFNSDVYSDAIALKSEGLVEISRPLGRRWAEYGATPEGIERAAEIAKQAPAELHEHLRSVVKWAKSVTFEQLVRAIYAQYPAFRANSVFQG